MDEIPWHLVAIVFITFAIWLRDRIREATEWRRQRKSEKKAKEFARRAGRTPSEPTSPYVTDYEEEVVEEPKTFRQLFEEVQRQVEPEEEPEPTPQELYEATTKSPPPLPGEVPAIDYEEIDPTTPTEPMRVRKRRKRSHRNTGDSLKRILKNQRQLQNAIVLKEVLDKPKALREESSF